MSKIVESKSTVESKSIVSHPGTAYDEDWDNDEIVSINGFWIFRSQLDLAKRIFEKHPETASNFCLKSEFAKETYLTALLDLIDMMNMLPQQSLFEAELKEAQNTILDLEAAGFKLDWLKRNLEEIRFTKKKVKDRTARMRELDRKIQKHLEELSVLQEEMKKEQFEAMCDKPEYHLDSLV
ncbi:unnamed protein product [Arabidopsis lyrata]|uniref:Predicted protein n=1 Tax=Arabidopsis lyrata subsp. lyrata TaxID=81972 RepID=D7L8P3_ARALL|nr:predicted protein [Arabidopsis lyrata subsp. lyrata]CAH8261981.1 unnamed protein product [Arabidopsis lyrata]